MQHRAKYNIGDIIPVIYFKMSKSKESINFIDPFLVSTKVGKSLTDISTINLKIINIVKCLRKSITIGGKPDKDFTYIAEDENGNKFYSLHPDTDEKKYKNVHDISLVFSRNLEKPDLTKLDNYDHYDLSELKDLYCSAIGHFEEMGEWHRYENRPKDARWYFTRLNKLNSWLIVLDKICRERNLKLTW